MSPPESRPITAALDELGQWLWPAAADLPVEVNQRAQRLWLDTVSCAWAGLRAAEPARWLAIQAVNDGGQVRLPGSSLRLSASAATTAFAVGACWDEACEGLALAHGRPGVPVVAALWSQIAARRPNWQTLWQATAVGYEVAGRLGARLRIRPGMHVDGVWGAFGAAAALVWLRGGSWQEARSALEACAVQLPFTLYRPVREGANVRNLYLGHSAWLGLQAAQAVEAGFATPTGALDDVASLALDPTAAGDWPRPGSWLILQSYWKPFAAVRHVHYGAQAALTLRAQLPPGAQIEELRLQIYPEALQYCGNRAPQTVIAAQFSLSFGLAAALVFGDLSPAEYRDPCFADPRLRRLEALLELEPDAQTWPAGQRGARLSARVGDRWWAVHQGPVAGDAGNEPSQAELNAKFTQFTQNDPAMAAWAQRVRDDDPQAPACHP
jgi:2-methylcitrate dehydratase PrpD